MSKDDCKFIIDDTDLDEDVKKQYWKDMMAELEKTQDGRDAFSEGDIENIIKVFTNDFMDRAERIKFSRIMIRSHRNKLKQSLETNPINFIKKLSRTIETKRDQIRGSGEYFIRQRMNEMSDNGVRFRSGELDEAVAGVFETRAKGEPEFKHEDDDVMFAYHLIKDFDTWDLQRQMEAGVTVEKLSDHTLKLENQRSILMEVGEDEWVADQKRWRNPENTWGPKNTEVHIDLSLREEYKKITDRTYNNSSRPNRLMSRGASYKPGAILLHNAKYGSGTAYDSMGKTLRKTANESAMQSIVPVDKAKQQGIAIRDPDKIIDIIAESNLEFKHITELVERIESAAENEVSPHITELVKRSAERITALGKKLQSNEVGLDVEQTKKEVDFLMDYTKRLELELKLDDFIGRAPKEKDDPDFWDKFAAVMNLFTKKVTGPLLGKGAIASIADAQVKYAQNMEFYGEASVPKNLFDALQQVFYGAGANVPILGKLTGATERVAEIEDFLAYTLSFQKSLEDMLGLDATNPMDAFRHSNKYVKGFMHTSEKITDLEFFMNGISHMNNSSFTGSIWAIRKKLNMALNEQVPSQRAAELYATMGLNEQDIATLSAMMVDGKLSKELLQTDSVLFGKVQTGMIAEGFLGTPKNDARTNEFIGKATIWGQKPTRSASKFRKALYNARTSLIKTPISAKLNMFEVLSRNVDRSTNRGKAQQANRVMQMMVLAGTLAGTKKVLYEALKSDPESGDLTGANVLDRSEFMRIFHQGFMSAEALGPLRDVLYNFFTANKVGLADNLLGPSITTAGGMAYEGINYVKKQIDVAAGYRDPDEAGMLDPRQTRNMVKRSFIGFNLPFLDAMADEYVVYAFMEMLQPGSVEEYKEKQIDRKYDKMEKWSEINDAGSYWNYISND